MTRGRFIVFEGGEGAGKSTQARLLAEALGARGLSVVHTREPGGTPGGEAVRGLLLAPPGEGWPAAAEALLFAAARSDHVAKVIRPALESGRWVICDRFVDSSRAYQGAAGGVADEDLLDLHRIGSGGLLPDLVILLEVSPAEAGRRLARRDGGASDAIGGREAAYHAQVAAAFCELSQRESARFARIETGATIEETHRHVLAAVEPLFGQGT